MGPPLLSIAGKTSPVVNDDLLGSNEHVGVDWKVSDGEVGETVSVGPIRAEAVTTTDLNSGTIVPVIRHRPRAARGQVGPVHREECFGLKVTPRTGCTRLRPTVALPSPTIAHWGSWSRIDFSKIAAPDRCIEERDVTEFLSLQLELINRRRERVVRRSLAEIRRRIRWS